MWVESIPGMGDFKPLNIEYGEFLIGYLNQCRHGNKVNETGKTRVSFDFRVVPGFAYDDSGKKSSFTTNQKFIVGEYYDKMDRPTTPKTFYTENNEARR
jgi:ectoine hydroxylase-related dioxygenase (phytanoyl-CoA dioxygenase family)